MGGGLCGCVFFFQAEDGIRDAQESRGLGDVYKRQVDVRVAIAKDSHGVPWLCGPVGEQAASVEGAVILSLIHI